MASDLLALIRQFMNDGSALTADGLRQVTMANSFQETGRYVPTSPMNYGMRLITKDGAEFEVLVMQVHPPEHEFEDETL